MEDDDDARSGSRSSSLSLTDSQSPSHPSVSIAVTSGSGHHHHHPGDGALVDDPVTVVASPQQALAIALPVQQPRSSGKDAGGSGGREDCWSEGATSTLIDAWGERYLELSRGNLKQKHWQEVADAVTSRDSYTKPPKTDVQCKNRIDTLKKKYKIEKNKISASGASSWPFFHRLDLLLSPNHNPSSGPKPQSLPLPSKPNSHQKILAGVPIRTPSTQMRPQFPQRQRTSHPAFKKMRSSPPPTVSSKSEDGASSADSSDGLPPPPPPPSVTANGKRQQKKQQQQQPGRQGTQEQVDEGRVSGLRELTEAILRFGEVYEKVESSKMQQATEMEKQRMAFAKELEIQRMQFFMKTQVELSQLKSSSPSRGRGSWKKRRLGDAGGSSNHSNGNNNNNSSNSNNN